MIVSGRQIRGLQRGRDRHHFEHRSRFKRRDHGQIFAALRLFARMQPLIQIVSRIIRQCQNFARVRIHRDQASVLGVIRESQRLFRRLPRRAAPRYRCVSPMVLPMHRRRDHFRRIGALASRRP